MYMYMPQKKKDTKLLLLEHAAYRISLGAAAQEFHRDDSVIDRRFVKCEITKLNHTRALTLHRDDSVIERRLVSMQISKVGVLVWFSLVNQH